MKVQNIYQDSQGEWHVEYGINHLMGLALRVYLGQFILGLALIIPFIILGSLTGYSPEETLPEEEPTSLTVHIMIQDSETTELNSDLI